MPQQDTIAVAMSGGVDSSAVAALLHAQGHPLVGLTLQLWNQRRLAANYADLGLPEKMVSRMPKARFILLPITDATRGHGTHTQAAIWKDYLVELLQRSEPKP